MSIGRHHPAKTQGKKRSGKWPTVRRKHLAMNPTCAICGGNKKLEVHHMRPFHLHPDLELDPKNLITLCENQNDGVNCHLLFGHLGSYRSFNVNVQQDAASWAKKIARRP
jgi:5-methylcytosine-specific restriction endonuclease McrA